MRRARFPVQYSQGFNPRPRMAFASALALGATSDWELCQLDLARDLTSPELSEALEALRAQLPPGIEIREAWPIPLEKRSSFIQATEADYELTLVEPVPGRARQFLEESSGPPGAREWALREDAERLVLTIRLPVGERGGVRVKDVVAHLESGMPGVRVTRLHRARLRCEQEPGQPVV